MHLLVYLLRAEKEKECENKKGLKSDRERKIEWGNERTSELEKMEREREKARKRDKEKKEI